MLRRYDSIHSDGDGDDLSVAESGAATPTRGPRTRREMVLSAQQKNFRRHFLDPEGKLYPLSTAVHRRGKLGVGIALYFAFLSNFSKFMLGAAVVAVIQLREYADGSAVTARDLDSWFTRISVVNLDGRTSVLSVGMELLFVMMLFVFVSANGEAQEARVRAIQGRLISTADYSIHVKNVPRSLLDKRALADFFEQFGQVAEVTIAVDAHALLHLLKDRRRVHNALERAMLTQHLEEPPLAVEPSLLQRLGLGRDAAYWQFRVEEMDRLARRFLQVQHDKVLRGTGHAFVTFEDVRSVYRTKRAVTGRCGGNALRFEGNSLKISDAMEPGDVIWENLGTTSRSRLSRKAATLAVSVVIVLMSALLVTLMLSLKNNIPGSGAVSIGISVAIVTLNWLLMFVFSYLCSFERRTSRSSTHSALTIKLTALQVVNYAVSLYLAVVFTDIFDIDTTAWARGRSTRKTDFDALSLEYLTSVWLREELIQSYTVVVIGQAIFAPLRRLLLPMLADLRTWILSRRAVSQRELDLAYSLPDFSLAHHYAVALVTIYLPLFYSSAVPIVVPVTILSLVAQYWLDKISLLRHYQLPAPYGSRTALRVAKTLPWLVVLHMTVALCVHGVYGIEWETSILRALMVLDFATLDSGDWKTQDYGVVILYAVLLLSILWYFVLPLLPPLVLLQRLWRLCCPRRVTVNRGLVENAPPFSDVSLELYELPFATADLGFDEAVARADVYLAAHSHEDTGMYVYGGDDGDLFQPVATARGSGGSSGHSTPATRSRSGTALVDAVTHLASTGAGRLSRTGSRATDLVPGRLSRSGSVAVDGNGGRHSRAGSVAVDMTGGRKARAGSKAVSESHNRSTSLRKAAIGRQHEVEMKKISGTSSTTASSASTTMREDGAAKTRDRKASAHEATDSDDAETSALDMLRNRLVCSDLGEAAMGGIDALVSLQQSRSSSRKSRETYSYEDDDDGDAEDERSFRGLLEPVDEAPESSGLSEPREGDDGVSSAEGGDGAASETPPPPPESEMPPPPVESPESETPPPPESETPPPPPEESETPPPPPEESETPPPPAEESQTPPPPAESPPPANSDQVADSGDDEPL